MKPLMLCALAVGASAISFGQECPDVLPETINVCVNENVELIVPAVNNDPHFDDVVFQTTGASGQIADESCYQWSLNSNGTPTLNPDGLIGDESLEFNANEDVSTNIQSEMAVSGDFTMELWYKVDQGAINQHRHLIRFGNGNDFPNDNYVMITLYRSGLGSFGNKIGFQWKDDLFDAGEFTQGAWEHLALARDGNTWRFYRNGNQVLSVPNNVNLNIPSRVFLPAGNSAFDGLIDGVRITNGVCRYPGGNSFTPPDASHYQTCDQSYSNIQWSTGSAADAVSILADQDSTVSVSFDTPLATCADTVHIITSSPNPELGTDSLTLCGGAGTSLSPGTTFTSFEWSTGETSSSIEVTTPGVFWVDVADDLGCTNRDSINVQTLNDTIAYSTLNLCEGDSILLSNSGNSDVLWNNGSTEAGQWVSPAADSVFTAVFSSQGAQCTDSISVTVLPFQFEFDVTEPSCFGATGSIELTATGASISTSPQADFLSTVSPGTYLIRVSSTDGCHAEELVVVNGPSELRAFSEAISPQCTSGNDGRILLSASGGSGTLSFDWSGIDPNAVAAGVYPVEITDEEGCTLNLSVTVAESEETCGCTYDNASNFDPSATREDGSCTFDCFGDSNGDNLINSSDLLFFLGTFGSVCE